MTSMNESLDRFREVETGEAFTPQNSRLPKVELSQTPVMARNGAMVAYQGDLGFGMGSGESFQLGFGGQGWVLIQPSEGQPVPTA